MNNYFKLFFYRILNDLKLKELLPLKLLFFVHSSTVLVLYPYLTIHMRELGINVQEAATMTAIGPVIAFIMPPLTGLIADKIGNFRVMLAICSGLGGAAALLLLLVPVGRVTIIYPDKIILGMSCPTGDLLHFSVDQQHPCNSVQNQTEIPLQLESCGFACKAVLTANQSHDVVNTQSFGLQMFNLEKNLTTTYAYTLTEEDLPGREFTAKTLNLKTLRYNERYLTAIRKLSKNLYYFPTATLFNLSCDLSETTDFTQCVLGASQTFDHFKKPIGKNFAAILKPLDMTVEDSAEQVQYFNAFLQGNRNTTCLDGFISSGQYVSINIPILNENKTDIIKHLELGSCAPKCISTAPRKLVCSNDKTHIEFDMSLTFWTYLAVRVLVGVFSGISFAMFEGAVIAILREHKADYGLQRIYASIGGMISSPLSGLLVDYASQGKDYTNFTPIFFLYAILKVLSGFLMLFINLEFKKPAQSVFKEVITVLKNLELIVLFIACLVLGSAWGYIESFLFWLLQDMGGSKTLMGLTITIGGLVGIPFLVLSGPIIKRIGHTNVIFLGFVFYAIRLVGYSVIYNPWLCLIFEAMESITFGLSFTAAVTYAAKLSTTTTDATIQGLLGGFYFAVGKGIGSLVGGHLMKRYGIREVFQKFAIFISIFAVVFIAFYHLYMKKRSPVNNGVTKKDVEKPTQEFVNVDLNVKTPANNDVPISYEDTLANPAFESPEFDEQEIDTNKTNKTSP